MADSIKDKLEAAGHSISEAATKAGHTISEGAEKAADWAKEKTHEAANTLSETAQKVENKAKEVYSEHGPAGTVADITEHMDVIASCGTKIGRVDHVQGSSIKLTKNDDADGLHHIIPASWVARVDSHVHLNKTSSEAKAQWQVA
ncbi:DUF2171 domain-containing protein [Isosphaeraceae bacterium EP7]